MKITGIKTHIVSSRHRNAKRNWLLLRLTTDEGLEGYGEASMLGHDRLVQRLLEEWVETYLLGANPLHHERHWRTLFRDSPGHGGRLFSTALSGIDLALWDLKGKALGVPLYELLGGPLRERLRVYANGWYTNPGTPEQQAADAREVVARGYTALKFDPFGRTNYDTISPEEAQLAEDRVAAVREAVGPHVEILVEVHAKVHGFYGRTLGGGGSNGTGLFGSRSRCIRRMCRRWSRCGSGSIYPLPPANGCMGSFPSSSCSKPRPWDILQPDICNAGGITELKKIAAMAEAQHVLMAPHNTNSAVGTVASFHLDAALPNFLIQEYHAEFYEPHYFEVFDGLPRQVQGYVDLPGGPGLGLTFNEAVAAAHPYQPLD